MTMVQIATIANDGVGAVIKYNSILFFNGQELDKQTKSY